MIESDALRPDWEIARKHGSASLPGLVDKLSKGESSVCPCCMNRINKLEVPLCENSKSLEFLGYGFPLYFIFIKYALILVMMLIITYTSIVLYWSARHSFDFCELDQPHLLPDGAIAHCTSWMVMLARTDLAVSEDETIVRVTSFAVQLLILIYIRDILMKTKQYYDQREISPSDFSILVENLPKVKGVASLLKRLLQDRQIFRKEFKVESVVYISQLDKYFDLKSSKQELILKLKKMLNKQNQQGEINNFSDEIKVVEQEILEVKKQIKEEQLREKEAIKNDQAECEKVILIINTEAEKEEVIEDFLKADRQKIDKYFGLKTQLEFKEAPEPREILWENINEPRTAFVKRLLISWSAYSLLLGSVTVCFFYLMSLKTVAVEHADSGKKSQGMFASMLVYGSLLLILLFNKFILSTISQKLTSYQKQKTGGDYQFSFALKHVLGLFFTTAIMTLLVEDIKFHNIYTHQYGVIQEQTIMFFMNGFLAPIIWLINPWHICQTLKRKYYQDKQLCTQDQANKLMEKTHYSIGKRYSEVIEGIWFTFLYASLIPIGSCLTFIGLGMFYWIDKYNLLRKSSVLQNVSSHISMQAMTLLDFTLVLRPLGELLFDSQIRTSNTNTSLICFIIGIVYLIIPTNKILDFIHPEEFDLADQTYSETKNLFPFNYYTLHPLRASSQRLKSENILDTEQQQLKGVEDKQDDKQRAFIRDEKDAKSKGSQNSSKLRFQQSMDSFQLNETNCNEPNLSANGLIKGLKSLPPLRQSRRKINLNKII